MYEELIAFETAKLAKEKGFQEINGCLYGFIKYKDTTDPHLKELIGYANINIFDIDGQEERLVSNTCNYFGDSNGETYEAPTQSLLQRWLREKHGIFIVLLPDSDNGMFGYDILIKGDIHTQANTFELDEVIGTYEEALEQGLLEGLKLIK